MTPTPRLPTAFVLEEDYLAHDTGPMHPETPDRLLAIARAVSAAGFGERLQPLAAREATAAELTLVHDPRYVALVERECRAAPNGETFQLSTGDTVLGARSERIARLAAGGVLAACDEVLAGRARNAFCAVRPPGHHAMPDAGMGFCLYDNVAIAARWLQRQRGLERILVADFDYHHGNGTEDAFYADPTVLVFSCHDRWGYPRTGLPERRGVGAGEGYNLNVHMPPRSDDALLLKAHEEILVPAARRFRPDFLLVSAGFDGHRSDPLGNLGYTEEGFTRVGTLLSDLAGELCGGRIVAALEGGYHLDALGASVVAFLDAWSAGA